MTDVTVVQSPPSTVVVSEPTTVVVPVSDQAPPLVNVTIGSTTVVEVANGTGGVPGPAGGLLGLEYTASTPSATWIIPIPTEFTRRPAVSIYDLSGEEVEADITVGATTVTVTFSGPFAGTALLN